MSEVTFRTELRKDGWKLRDSFCGVYLYDSKNKKYQIIHNLMTAAVEVVTGKMMNEIVWKGSMEEFVSNYKGFVNGAVSFS